VRDVRIVAALLVLVLVSPGAAFAGDAPSARVHYKRGRDHVNFGEYEAAIKEFQAGYAIEPQPLFLFNIAECFRAAGRDEQAVDYYNRYLEARPEAPDRAEVRRWIVKLSKRRPGTEAPAAAAAPASAVATPVAATPTAATPAMAPAAAPTATLDTAPRSRKGLWIGLGIGGAVVVAGAVVLAVLLTRPSRGGPPSGYDDWGRFGLDGR